MSFWIYNPELEPTVIAVHGFRGNHKALTDFARAFPAHRVIVPDLPGFGLSDPLKGTHTVRQYAKFLDAFAWAVRAGRTFTLWGHSYGGIICLEYAALFPERLSQLIVVSPAVPAQGVPAALGRTYYKTTYLWPERWQKLWLSSRLIDHISGELLIKHVSRRRKAELEAAGRRNLREARPRVIVELALSYFKTNLYAVASRVPVDTLIVAGALDQIVPLGRLEQLAAVMPHAQLEILPDQGHLAPLEEPIHTARLTQEFMAG